MVRLVVMHTGYVAVTRPDAARDTIVPAGPNFPGLSDALEGIAAAGASGLLLRSVGVPLAGTIAPVRIFLIMIGAVSSRIRAVPTRFGSPRRLDFSCWPAPRW